MILTLIGGGAHRLLGTVRSALSSNAFMDGGEIRLYDLDAHRAEVMAEMIKKSPEYKISPVPVLWDLTLEKALDGADLVSVTLLAGGRRQLQLESMITSQYGFMSSDNISYTGAFLALRGIPIALNVARNMEKYCPDAVMLDFANPVAVLSAAVRMATNIKCYGICEGHMNHGWDYNRILTGEDAFDPDYDVLVAGVNHMSFIVDGTIHGRNLKQAVLERIRSCPDWLDRIAFTEEKSPGQIASMRGGIKRIADILTRHDALLFSTEGDGFSHLYYEDAMRGSAKCDRPDYPALLSPKDMEKLDRDCEADKAGRAKNDAVFEIWSSSDDIPWDDPFHHELCYAPGDVTAKILQGLAGAGDVTVAISDINCSSVENLDPSLVLEYSHRVSKKGIERIGGLKVPIGVYGMTASIAAHQTLLARAGVEEDPALLYAALRAYPIGSDTRDAHELWKKLILASKDCISPSFQSMPDLYEI